MADNNETKLNDIDKRVIEGDPNGLGAKLSQMLGDYVLDRTKSPLLAAGAKTVADLAPLLMGLKGGPKGPAEFVNPIEGLPKSSPGPSGEVVKIANQYMSDHGIAPSHPEKYVKASPEAGSEIAKMYETLTSDPSNPQVKRAYDALTNETLNQYKYLKNIGIKFDRIDPNQSNPYPNGSSEAINDITKNKHLWFYPTDQGFGSLSTATDHPLLAETNESINGKPLLANDVFRIVHDVFGHAKEGVGFGASGEENAWRSHMPMFSPDAQQALTTETRGQNSWVNYGPYGEANQKNPANTTYADQKAGILPPAAFNKYAGGGVVEPPGLDQFLSQPQQTQNVPQGTIAPEPAGLDQFISEQQNEKAHGTPLEQTKAAVEGVARGATLGLSDLAETKLGISTPENITGREAANPVTSAASQIGGGAALIGLTGGIAAPIEEGLGGGMAATAAGYGAEGAGFGMGNVISDRALGDPDLNAQKISTEVGMSALLGVGAGLAGRGLKSLLGKHGYIKGSPSDVVSDAASEANSDAETANTIQDKSRFKSNAPEIIQAAQDLGAPLSEGMVSADPWIQKAEDALVNGAPTYAGIKRAKLYEQGYEAAKKALTTVVGEPEAEGGMSKAQLGKALEQSLASRIDEENQPISALYNEVKSETSLIPLSERSLPRITQNIMDLDPVRLDPDGPAGQLARRMSKNIENIKTVDDAKALRKVLSDSLSKTASDGERYIMGEIADRVKALEENTITKHTENLIASILEGAPKDPAQLSEYEQIWGPKVERLSGLLEQKKQADALYRPFIGKIKTLAQMLGKKSVSGAQGAINFISTDLSPEQLASRAFQKGNSEMAEFFAKSFPNEWELVKQYQKGVLRDSSVMDRTGQFSSRAFIKKVDGLEPEIQKLLFSPDELKKINAAKTYLRSIPESFNPSGTSHMSAFREFFTHPTGAAISNARDFGIDAYIKAMGKVPDSIRPNPIETGSALAEKFNKLNSVRNVVDRVDSNISKGAKAIFQSGAGRGLVLEGASVGVHSYEDRTHRIQELASNFNTLGNHLSNSVEGLQSQLPNISQSMQNHMSASVLFLQSKIPRPNAQFMLSPEWKPSEMQKQKFNRYYESVANPVGVLQQIKTGKLTGEAVEAIQATHPDMFQEMRTKVLGEIDSEKAKALPYSVKLCLAKFLGQPLDASMLPQVIISNQLALNQPSSPNGMSPKQQRSNQAGLAKLKVASRATTDTQDLEEEKA